MTHVGAVQVGDMHRLDDGGRVLTRAVEVAVFVASAVLAAGVISWVALRGMPG